MPKFLYSLSACVALLAGEGAFGVLTHRELNTSIAMQANGLDASDRAGHTQDSEKGGISESESPVALLSVKGATLIEDVTDGR